MKAYSVKQAAELIGVCRLTIKNWIYKGKLQSFKTPTGYHRIPDHEIQRIIQLSDNKPVILYSRVSSYQQKDDLERQKQRLISYAKQHNYDYIELYDIASGLNDKRKKLFKAFEMLRDNQAHVLIVEHRDRLTRFGFNYLQFMIESWRGKIIIIEDKEIKEDLIRDLVEIMVSFCARIYGKRSNKTKARSLLDQMK